MNDQQGQGRVFLSIPEEFWVGLTPEEIAKVCANDSALTPKLKEKFLKLSGIEDPGEVRISVPQSDVERLARKKHP